MKPERINLLRSEIEETIDKVFKEMDAAKRNTTVDWQYLPANLHKSIYDSLKKEFAAKPILRPVDE